MRPTDGICDSKSRRSELLSASGMNDVFYDVDAPRPVVHGPTHCRVVGQRQFSTAIVPRCDMAGASSKEAGPRAFSSKDAAGNELEWGSVLGA